ncbi:MAG: acyltransferase [Alphaproteobacteria bacterium]|nr:MAG: acyltransferase [Alphaproteobacteria bacterium]
MAASAAVRHARPPVPATGRVDWVDHAKGLCIILVVMMHSVLGVEKALGDTGWMHGLVQFAKPFRMPDFFLIAGLFLGLVIDRPWRRYLDRRVVHFLYFYVLWVTIQFAFKAPGWLGEGQSPADVLGQWLFAFVQPFGTLWFIYLLPVFAVVTRLARPVPWPMLIGAAALLEILPVATGSMIVDEFAARYVYFLAGYLFAGAIFAVADRAAAHRPRAGLLLAGWIAVNGALAFTPVPAGLLGLLGHPHGVEYLSDLPVVSLALGAAGAVGIVVVTALLAAVPWAGFLAYLGRNSIVVYLAFFLPMAVSRAVLVRFAPFLDIGTVSLIVTICGVAGPVVLHLLVQWTGHGRFLFERPAWARLEREERRAAGPALRPAE